MLSKKVIALLIVTVFISFVAWSRWHSERNAPVAEARPVAVRTITLSPAEMTQTLAVSGTLAGEYEATVVSETHGTIVAVRAQVGEWLNKGATIVQVENDLKLVAVEQARAQLLTAQTNHEKAVKDRARYEELFQQQITTQSVLENARLAERAALAQLKSAEAALKLAQRQYDDTFIKTPLAGRLADRYVDAAVLVRPGDRVGVVVDARRMKLKTSVAESEVALLRHGQPAVVTVDALPGRTFNGRVVAVAQKANSERTYAVEILVENDAAESLKSGMFGRSVISVARAENALVVPRAALLSDLSGHHVFVEENGIARRVPVALGLQEPERVQIVSGPAAGAHLVVSGQQRLSDGDKVIVQE
ncbi:MAG: efflux RND transporter periplasmic adaptor subunit [candidate division KSB1 bacterium]|nr:efflux RND transporter periplasmic adaptor subunit [candidate division KSB1 bacterium]MDZ7274376.1 efflux RND transporter periplasmic adaptor subunit [candidate division KSB1 bacterium]MDZ7284962.1 efflux RND transporter periplasmic adaptor subunit [candidate division KSB1 bacterium]MDZ7297617.1 efflux RND transporter periplasmic adaptor subunit [candidate division KSB1 bacterium]MDZ7306357.1 efflux RND transporter periplasmic adaptor subunit [candidate division KSB1 bacterium]